ncbi:MAG: hypothetical protein IPK44_02455 [Candidatus Accumulibacter sp.]|uniref:hypothetical protein n=1 Tax=Accumulibacter sp. TaxID=2053492 RepID=UPI00258B9A94|nr:hypothetical protein [Accumulibacter sp.]MBK8113463.1 hypothetical protein [Accumulibacter sp.]
MSQLRIECVISNDSMGDATEADAQTWADYVEKRLNEEYPNADITVSVNCRQSSVEIVDGEGEDGAREFLKMLWDRELSIAFPA